MTLSPPPPPFGSDYSSQPPGYALQKPRVVTWFTVYTLLMAVMYLLVAVAGAALLYAGPDQFAGERHDAFAVRFQVISMIVLGLPLFILFGIAPWLPRKRAVWIYDLVLICIGLTSICCLPITIPLLIFWIKENTKAWFRQ